jgi:hypothetical protein
VNGRMEAQVSYRYPEQHHDEHDFARTNSKAALLVTMIHRAGGCIVAMRTQDCNSASESVARASHVAKASRLRVLAASRRQLPNRAPGTVFKPAAGTAGATMVVPAQ